jgi:hypothetical protein
MNALQFPAIYGRKLKRPHYFGMGRNLDGRGSGGRQIYSDAHGMISSVDRYDLREREPGSVKTSSFGRDPGK